jgi:hypothetical protein
VLLPWPALPTFELSREWALALGGAQAAEQTEQLQARLHAGVHHAYSLLSSACSTPQGAHLVGVTFEKNACVWVGDGFAHSKNVAMGAAAASSAPAAGQDAEDAEGGCLLPRCDFAVLLAHRLVVVQCDTIKAACCRPCLCAASFCHILCLQ